MNTSRFALAMLLSVCALSVHAAATPATPPDSALAASPVTAPELNDASLKKIADLIRPTDAESGWKKVGWRTKFWPAVLEAQELQRPILLWAMNGHPCAVV